MRPWKTSLWGVEFSSKPDKDTLLIGEAWHTVWPSRYAGEPTRCLLFLTRRLARLWCAEQRAKYQDRTDCCRSWRFRPVRVLELITPL